MKYKKEIGIIIIVVGLVFLLRFLNIFQIENDFGKIPNMIFMILLLSVFIIIIQRILDREYMLQKRNYHNIDLCKYLFSILIIILHLRPFLGVSNELDLTFNNIVTRICVPFFFFTTGYIVSTKQEDYIPKYIKKILPFYLVWSAIYVPIILGEVLRYLPLVESYMPFETMILMIPFVILLWPLILFIALLYTGIYYHLWYFPALLLSLYIIFLWQRKFKIKSLFILSFVLLLFGATETYYGVLPIHIQNFVTPYYHIFFTTRNFLFFGLFYVVFGYAMGKKAFYQRNPNFIGVIISFFLLIFEALLLHDTSRLNSNILLSCIPLTYYLFTSLLYFPNLINEKKAKKLRALSKYYYLVHPMVIFFCTLLLRQSNDSLLESVLFLSIVIISTHVLSYIVVKIKRKYPKLNL